MKQEFEAATILRDHGISFKPLDGGEILFKHRDSDCTVLRDGITVVQSHPLGSNRFQVKELPSFLSGTTVGKWQANPERWCL